MFDRTPMRLINELFACRNGDQIHHDVLIAPSGSSDPLIISVHLSMQGFQYRIHYLYQSTHSHIPRNPYFLTSTIKPNVYEFNSTPIQMAQ